MRVHGYRSNTRPGSTMQVLDFLETFDGAWYSFQNLADNLPAIKPVTLRRTLDRLREVDAVQTRLWPQTARNNIPGSRRGVVDGLQFRVPNRRWLDKLL